MSARIRLTCLRQFHMQASVLFLEYAELIDHIETGIGKTFMTSKILINASDPGECRVATVKDGRLEEFRIESSAREITHGNIYKGVITRIEPGLQSVFVDYGAERHGFLQKHEIHPDYFLDNRTGDESISHIVRRGQELLVQVTKDPILNKGAMLTTFISLPDATSFSCPGAKTKASLAKSRKRRNAAA